MDNVTKVCNTTYRAYHTSGKRNLADIRLVVMHDTEGGTAESVAQYFSRSSSGGSAHLVVDDTSCYRCLRDDDIPWGAPGANLNGFHIEQCGYARWTNILWSKTHRLTLERAAYKAALHCRKYGIPPYFIVASEVKSGKSGVTTHAEVSKAYGGTHTDPGPGWPRYYFMRRVRSWYKRLDYIPRVA